MAEKTLVALGIGSSATTTSTTCSFRAATEVGDGTPYPFVDPDGRPVPPSQQMQPLNEAAEEE
jgi:hypothetical protein